MDAKAYEKLGFDLVPLVQKQIDAAVAPLLVRIAELEGRSLKYFGVWQSSQNYPPGAAVTMDGSLFSTGRATVAERPLTPNSPWQLAVKAGAK